MVEKELTEAEKAEQAEAYKQLPAEVRASLGKVIKFRGKWAVQLPPVHFRQGYKEKHLERFLSTNGEAMRVFYTKQQAEEALGYYQQLMIARVAMREEKEKEEDLKIIEEQNTVQVEKPEPEPQEGWPVPDDYDPSKVTGAMYTGKWVDYELAHKLSVEAGEFLNAEPWQPTTWSATSADE